MSINTTRRRCAVATTSWLALSLAMSSAAFAQSTPAGGAAVDDSAVSEVIVVGARASQQSANARKRNASTAVDSIVADDVGAFPDKNLNEALSRIAGVALERDEFGDGTSITLRGNSNENIRVEVDGLGVQGGGMGATRSAELTTLPADLIKSVDVIKGSTAAMTEGGLGGSVQVTTRTGLDFRKPYLSLRLGGRKNSLGNEWNPDYNLVVSRKFFDDRLGVLFSVSGIRTQNITNQIENNNNPAGYQGRLVDFDNSLEKTFEYNPSTVSSPVGETRQNIANDLVMSNSVFTPRQIITMSAAAKVKGDCATAFPFLAPTAALNSRNQRIAERQTCLSQWNDLLPNLPRFFDNTQYDERISADLRFDFRVTDNLTVYARGQQSDRKVDRYFRPRTTGGSSGSIFPGAGIPYNAVTNPNGLWTLDTSDGTRRRVAAPGNTNVSILPGLQSDAGLPIEGIVSFIVPSSVEYDANHFVTEFVANNQTLDISTRHEPFNYSTTLFQAGGDYNNGNLRLEFMAGHSATDFDRYGTNAARGFNYGAGRFFVQPSGLWASEPLVAFDESDPAQYVQMSVPGPSLEIVRGAAGNGFTNYTPAYTMAQRASVSGTSGIEYNGWISETEETTAKFDLTYNFDESQPVITRFKAGVNHRAYSGSFWSNPGGRVIKSGSPDAAYYLTQPGTTTIIRDANNVPIRNPAYVAPIILPRAFLRSSIRACEPTATSTEPCNYGYQANLNPFTSLEGLLTVTPDELRKITRDTFVPPESNFFKGFPGAEGLSSWQGIDTEAINALFPNTNGNCIKVCTASDGKMYEQPYSKVEENITAAYAMFDFEEELPLNMRFEGNIGLRVVHTEVAGTGTLTLTARRVTAGFNPNLPNVAPVTDVTVSSNTSIAKTNRDVLPSFNAAVWVLPDQLAFRYYKGKNVARPSIGNLLPNGTCIIDEREDLGIEGFDDTCGRIGNPGLKPLTAWNQNISLEWYPNRDTLVSFAKFVQDESIGGVVGATASEFLLAGRGLVDPVTGASLDDTLFTFPTWTNGPGIKRDGWEVSTKTAFTFLPWYFRHLGADFNYSKVKAEITGGEAQVNPNTGEVLPPRGQPEFFANLSLWYDDGRTNARISAQKKAAIFLQVEGDSSNNRNVYQYPGGLNPRALGLDAPWLPGNPMFTDETLYVDLKISHKIRPDLEVFFEGRNVKKEAKVSSNGGKGPVFADGTPYINNLQYGGQIFSVGLTYRLGGN